MYQHRYQPPSNSANKTAIAAFASSSTNSNPQLQQLQQHHQQHLQQANKQLNNSLASIQTTPTTPVTNLLPAATLTTSSSSPAINHHQRYYQTKHNNSQTRYSNNNFAANQRSPAAVIRGNATATGSGLADERQEAIFRKVRGILNKITPETFDKLTNELINVGIDSPKTLRGLIYLLFDKALKDLKYSSLYAKLCQELSEKAPNFEQEHGPNTFCKFLISKCEEEFDRRRKATEDFDCKNELTDEEYELKAIVKQKMLGNIKFICELGKKRLLQEEILHECIRGLLSKKKERPIQDQAQDLECLSQIMRTIGSLLDTQASKNLMNQYFERIDMFSKKPELPSRIRFMLRDVIDLRNNKWRPRPYQREDYAPQPLSKLREEAGYKSKTAASIDKFGNSKSLVGVSDLSKLHGNRLSMLLDDDGPSFTTTTDFHWGTSFDPIEPSPFDIFATSTTTNNQAKSTNMNPASRTSVPNMLGPHNVSRAQDSFSSNFSANSKSSIQKSSLFYHNEPSSNTEHHSFAKNEEQYLRSNNVGSKQTGLNRDVVKKAFESISSERKRSYFDENDLGILNNNDRDHLNPKHRTSPNIGNTSHFHQNYREESAHNPPQHRRFAENRSRQQPYQYPQRLENNPTPNRPAPGARRNLHGPPMNHPNPGLPPPNQNRMDSRNHQYYQQQPLVPNQYTSDDKQRDYNNQSRRHQGRPEFVANEYKHPGPRFSNNNVENTRNMRNEKFAAAHHQPINTWEQYQPDKPKPESDLNWRANPSPPKQPINDTKKSVDHISNPRNSNSPTPPNLQSTRYVDEYVDSSIQNEQAQIQMQSNQSAFSKISINENDRRFNDVQDRRPNQPPRHQTDRSFNFNRAPIDPNLRKSSNTTAIGTHSELNNQLPIQSRHHDITNRYENSNECPKKLNNPFEINQPNINFNVNNSQKYPVDLLSEMKPSVSQDQLATYNGNKNATAHNIIGNIVDKRDQGTKMSESKNEEQFGGRRQFRNENNYQDRYQRQQQSHVGAANRFRNQERFDPLESDSERAPNWRRAYQPAPTTTNSTTTNNPVSRTENRDSLPTLSPLLQPKITTKITEGNFSLRPSHNLMNRTVNVGQTTTKIEVGQQIIDESEPNRDLKNQEGCKSIKIEQNTETEFSSKSNDNPIRNISKNPIVEKFTLVLDDCFNESSPNLTGVVSKIKELKVPKNLQQECIASAINQSILRYEKDRDNLTKLFVQLIPSNFETQSLLNGFKMIFKQLHALEVETPKVKSLIVSFVAQAIIDNLVTLEDIGNILAGGKHHPLFLLSLQQLEKKCGQAWLIEKFLASKINLIDMLPEGDRSKERLASILKDRCLGFLDPMLTIEPDLWTQMKNKDASPAVIYRWVKDNVDQALQNTPTFAHVLMTCLLKYIHYSSIERAKAISEVDDQIEIKTEQISPSSNKSSQGTSDMESEMLKKYQQVLQALLVDKRLQLQTLYALQSFYHDLDFPKGSLLRWFHMLYDMNIVDDEVFFIWKEEINDEYPGKGQALFQVNTWLNWLAEAESEEEEEEEM